jgi:hypothetical protein
VFGKVWVLTGEEKGDVLFYIILDEYFIRPSVVAWKHIMRYRTFPQGSCNNVPGTLGVIPSAVHFFHHVRCFGHVYQLVVEKKAFL